MKPSQILIYMLSVFGLLALVSFSFPSKGVKVGSFDLNFVSIPELFSPETVEYANINGIIDTKNAAIALSDLEKNNQSDNSDDLADTVRYDADSLKSVVHRIEFPENNRSILYPFFESLEQTNSTIHIVHYGDSQLEGDRISSYIRNRLQKQFGGYGPGLVSASPVIKQTMSVVQNFSENWTHYAIFANKDSTLTGTPFGAMLGYSRYKAQPEEGLVDTAKVEAWLTVEKTNISYGTTRKYSRFRLYYGDLKGKSHVKLFANDSLYAETDLRSGDNNVWKVNFESEESKIKLVFTGNDSPNVYGIALDSYTGVCVDNIPLRGSSGVEFTKNNNSHASAMLKDLNTKLIIMQFGVNVVPNIRESYKFYENWFYDQLVTLKKYNPDVPIIVIGVSDMSEKEGDYYVSYPNIELIRNAQKAAAFRAECGFWDMYEAMGGKNSMPSWVFANPPLASKDFTHFNYKGSVILSSMFYNAFLKELQAYKNRNEKTFQPLYTRQKIKHI
jgi:hypothetical protein